MKQRPASGGLVYSTESGRMCPGCRQPVAQCRCAKTETRAAAPGDGVVRVQRETKGRGGKAVTVVRGLPLEGAALVKVAQQLKAACGSGGTVKDGDVEVQGDHLAKVMTLLQEQGYTVKRVGGP
jgi:translation initiation factor 1